MEGMAQRLQKISWGRILENKTTVNATHTTAHTTAGNTVINNLDYGYYVVYPLGATDTSTAPK